MVASARKMKRATTLLGGRRCRIFITATAFAAILAVLGWGLAHRNLPKQHRLAAPSGGGQMVDNFEKFFHQRPKPAESVADGMATVRAVADEATLEQISRLEIRGVQVEVYAAKALINGRVVLQGERISCGKGMPGLIFLGVRDESLVFLDDAGNEYRRSLRRVEP
jgi:hypothetical protein